MRAAKRNMLSAIKNSAVVEQYLRKECELGRVMGPLKVGSIALPKSHQPGKWRLIIIVDLLHPSGASINDGIEPKLCSLSYTSVDNAVAIITQLQEG